eukprot:CAMPEP_0172309060 /NCGR_PEP_ID=MMETSP1058-20130122/9466_1 /TAXON_ID=83371 /ORGANISM="Detonula confervacea, Strain CCMP 353" /LENGTH=211 /DNA_ID=CAMNT_0013021613 /DNA_START=399 /DNA_END=1034 /DNA_ORIENTATION=+
MTRKSCKSAGDLRAAFLFDGASNKKNEEWKSITQDPCKMIGNGPQIKSSIRYESRTHQKKKRHLSFSETQGFIVHPTSPSDDMNIAWYKESDHEQFLNNATARASIIDRMMGYAILNESTYNSSTGLTSPEVLKEYLSSPEEIIGIEHLLTVQKTARKNLRNHHTKALLEEQRRQRQEGHDPLFLAERLRSWSTISAYLAKERALYIVLMD